MKAQAQALQHGAAAESSPTPAAGRRLPLVDDDPGGPARARDSFAGTAGTSLDVRLVETLSAALQALADPVDAIVLDLSLADPEGLETLRRIAEKSRDVPIVVVSDVVDGTLRADALREGAVEIFSKTETNSPLFPRCVLNVIQRHRARLQQRLMERLLEAAPDAILVVGLEGIVRYANQAALALLGRSREALVGEPLQFPVKDGELIKLAAPHRGDQRLCEVRVGEFEWRNESALLATLRDVTAEREAQRALRQFRLLVNGVTDYALCMLDPHGIITGWNTGAQLTAGYASDEVVGRHFSLLFTEKDRADQVPQRVLEEATAAGRFRAKLSRVRKDSTQFLGEVTIDPIHDEDGLLVGFAEIVRDITEQERLAWLQNEFISVVTHELRTPVTSLLGAIELARSPTFAANPAKADALIDLALNNARRLRSLVNDILDSERMRLGSIVVDLQPTDLGEVCRHAIADNQPYSRSYRVKLRLENLAGACRVMADKVRMEQLLANLLSNAIKFSKPEGEVLLRIERVGDSVRVSVTDHGLGIPKHLQDRVFERFFQVDTSDKRANSGTGLGLSIAKAIVEKHNGRIGVTSAVGKGATFYVDLPETGVSRRLSSASR